MFDGYKTTSYEHSIFKIDDTPGIQLTINVDQWNDLVLQYNNSSLWFGTHVHPTGIPNLDKFESVIVITTESRQSKLYRWLRYYYGWFKETEVNWIEKDDLESIDKIRHLSYNVFDTFTPHPACRNIEFEDIVSGKFIQQNNLNLDYFNIWKKKNSWLYSIDENSWAIKRFNEAEYEILTKSSYKYI